jgi:two-component system alkaline phosphatase synthesis response regulator PhoP
MATPRKLLIIDDDPDFVDGIKSVLTKAEYAVDIAYNPKEGWTALETGQYGLLLLDIMMGRGAEGVMIARKLRKDARLKNTPVLILTGMRKQISFLFPGGQVHPGSIFADELLEKPIEPALLLAKIAALLKAADAKKAQGVQE